MARRVEPGSEWVLRRGVHSGTVVLVEGQTFAGAVKYRVVKKGDNTGSAWGDDDGRVHTAPLDQFLTLHERNYRGNGGGQTHAAFRQNNAARRAAREAEMRDLESGVFEERQADLETMPRAIAPQTNGRNGHVKTDDGPLSIALEDISPEMAQEWLDRGGLNRKKSERNINKLMVAIQLGEWNPYTGETIKLRASDDTVGDGQHRLEAIVRSGMSVKCLVVRGIPDDAFDVIDTGRSRNAADVLSIHGHANQISLATAARGLILIERFGRHNVGSIKASYGVASPSNAAVLAYVEAHPELIDAVKMGDRVRKEGKFVGGSGLWATAFAMFLRISPEQTGVFVNSLVDGASLEPGNPILRLRAMYIGNRHDWSSSQESRERLLATVIKGWNAWRRDELVQMLIWRDSGRAAEKFPVAE